MKPFFTILSYLFTALFVLIALLLVVSTFKLPFFPLDARSVLTGSMEPSLPTGSLAFIYPQAEYVTGDIITFKPDGSADTISITHRIVAATTSEDGRTVFTTKGDANDGEDRTPVYDDEVYGKVIFHIPFLGRVLDIAKTPWGFAALIIIPAVMVIADEVKKIVAQVRRKDIVPSEETEEKDT